MLPRLHGATRRRYGLIGLGAGVLLAGLLAGGARAQTTLGVSPVRVEQAATPGATVEGEVLVSNLSPRSLELRVSVRDIGATSERGEVTLQEEPTPYSLRGWLTAEPAHFFLEAGGRAPVRYRLAVPPAASPGGRYGALVFTPVVEPQPGRVTLVGEVAVLFLLRVRPLPGQPEPEERVRVVALEAPPVVWAWPVSLVARVANDGAFHVRPRAAIRVTDWTGQEVARLALPEENIFPGGIRRLETAWDGGPLLVGLVSAVAEVRYGEDRLAVSAPQQIWVLPWWLFVVGAALLGLGLGVRWLLRAYARRLAAELRQREAAPER
ncbi:MAG TPA: hypothetical protein VFB73_01480 [Chloroflexota bacterium]|nr:hypothetical protein [Chloroflexota bacterium]